MLSRFFIERPIFATVIALFITLSGLIATQLLPVAQYPEVAPPSVNISVRYPGASAEVLDETVISVIEGEINGAENMIHMTSVSQVDGSAEIMVTFEPGTDPDMAQVDLQNRLARASPRLPQAVNEQGIQVAKATSDILMIITLSSTNDQYDRFALGDYASRNIIPEIQRAEGVGETRLFGAQQAMRIWLDIPSMISHNLTTEDIASAVRSQNAQVSAGIVGDLPALSGQQIAATLTVNGQLSNAKEFGDIVLRANPDGSSLRLRDVARVEMGGEGYAIFARKDGGEVIGMAVQPSPGSNAVNTVRDVRERMENLKQYFPEGVEYDVPIDSAEFISISIKTVFFTLLEAMLLVFLVIFLFLQNIRYTLIPSVVVPISLLGACVFLLATGFSLNVLTMFAMVLAIGILVDDAIVVIENVERIMEEEGLPPKEATIKAMSQITGAIIGISMVLVAVLLPMAFFGGAVGNIYRQFSATMAVSVMFSAFLALTLTPAMCATILKPVDKTQQLQKTGFFGWFNRRFDQGAKKYQGAVYHIVKHAGRYLFVYVLIVVMAAFLIVRLPTAFLPDEDQGRIFTITQLPPGATIERSMEVAEKIENFYAQQPEVENVISIVGTNFFGAGQNMINTFVNLKHWDERSGKEHSADALAERALGEFWPMREAFSVAINLPPIPALGRGTGFSVRMQDRGGIGYDKLMEARNEFLALAGESPVLSNVRVEGVEDAPQMQLNIDREKAYAMGVGFDDINRLLSVSLGSGYINDFPDRARMKKVIMQADAPFRMQADDILQLQLRNRDGDMVPLSAFADIEWVTGPMQMIRYNGYVAFRISGEAASGYSTGQAMEEVDRIMTQMPFGVGHEWTGISREERLSGAQAPLLLGLSLLAVFLFLAALYESWSIPFSVILVVPLGVLGSLLAANLLSMPNDVYFKVGLVAIIGLSSRNAILIIEFAKDLQAQGYELVDATMLACKQRLRPILMTSIAFIMGVLPLAIATGAGSAAQRAIGTGVMGGMISTTILSIFLVPLFFVVVRSIFKGSRRQQELYRKKAEEKMFNHPDDEPAG